MWELHNAHSSGNMLGLRDKPRTSLPARWQVSHVGYASHAAPSDDVLPEFSVMRYVVGGAYETNEVRLAPDCEACFMPS